MATINKKPTKAHKDKKVIKAHQGMAHVPKPTQGKTRGPIAPRPQRPRTQIEPAVVQQPIKRRRPPRISDGPLDGGGRGAATTRKVAPSTSGFFPNFPSLVKRRKPTRAEQKEINTGREIERRMRGNKVVRDNQADLQRRQNAELKRRGGALQVFKENMDYYRGGRKGKRPERVDPFKGMSSRERRRAQNATRSEFDETNRQVRKHV